MFVDKSPYTNPREWTKQDSIISEVATEACMVQAIAKSHHYKQQPIFEGFQHVCYYGKARRSGIVGTVRHAPGLECGEMT